jgi:Neutral/alkaline non-lysosomal ceramidase, N-terminal
VSESPSARQAVREATRVGFAQADISCAVGTPLGGNARTDKAARGVHDPLHATVAVYVLEGRHHVMVGLDLLSAPSHLVDAIGSAIESRTGIPASCVFVSATHTHSGPDVGRGHSMDQHDYTMVDEWERTAASVIAAGAAEAQREAVPASMRIATDEVPGLSFNRRLIHRDGSTRMNWEGVPPEDVLGARGPIDPSLLVLAFYDDAGAPLGAVVHFTLHPAILVGHEWLVSADYVAEASNLVSRALGGRPVLFLNGALGNINHLDFRKPGRAIGFSESARVGSALGHAAVQAIHGSSDPAVLDLVGFRDLTVTLEQRTVGRERFEAAQSLLAASSGDVEALDGIPPEAYAQWTVTAGRQLTPLLDVRIAILRLQGVVLVYVPFEVFVEFGLLLRDAFPDQLVKVVSPANGYFGYLPTAVAFAEGGYEPTLGTSTISPGQGEHLFHRIGTELRCMFQEEGAGQR